MYCNTRKVDVTSKFDGFLEDTHPVSVLNLSKENYHVVETFCNSDDHFFFFQKRNIKGNIYSGIMELDLLVFGGEKSKSNEISKEEVSSEDSLRYLSKEETISNAKLIFPELTSKYLSVSGRIKRLPSLPNFLKQRIVELASTMEKALERNT